MRYTLTILFTLLSGFRIALHAAERPPDQRPHQDVFFARRCVAIVKPVGSSDLSAPGAYLCDSEDQLASTLPTFNDAVATIKATLRADAGHEATHRWTATTPGSVRLVGQYQKTTAEATAVVRVLADGTRIWQHMLRKGDTIPHACDILACDLASRSTIELIVVAETGSQAFGADVFHLAGADRGPTLDRCEAAYGGDDVLNIHGNFGRVVQRAGQRRYYLQGAYDVGDTVEFHDARSVALLGTAHVVSVQPTPDGPWLAINDQYKATGECLVELDRTIDLPELSLVVLDGKRSAQGWVVRNCWFHDDFQRTLINGSPGGLVENTTLQNVGHGLCVQFETWGPWMEGPFARDLVIRNSRFLAAPRDGSAINISMHPPGGGSDQHRFEAKPVTNVTISGNYFGSTTSVPLCIHNVDGLKICGNNIDHPASGAIPAGLANTSTVNGLYLQDCDHVLIQANRTPTGTDPAHIDDRDSAARAANNE